MARLVVARVPFRALASPRIDAWKGVYAAEDGPRSPHFVVRDPDRPPLALRDAAYVIPAGDAPAAWGAHTFAIAQALVELVVSPEIGGETLTWAFGALPLELWPTAGPMPQLAEYDRELGSIDFGTGDGHDEPACAAADIVAHEVGHAILDAWCPELFDERFHPQVCGIHEAIADLFAVVAALQVPELQALEAQTRGGAGIATLAETFGPSGAAIRDLRVPRRMPPSGDPARLLPHELGRVLGSALWSVAAPALPHGADLPRVRRVARQLLRYVVRALPSLPPGVLDFGDVARTLTAVDLALHPGHLGEQRALTMALRERGVVLRSGELDAAMLLPRAGTAAQVAADPEAAARVWGPHVGMPRDATFEVCRSGAFVRKWYAEPPNTLARRGFALEPDGAELQAREEMGCRLRWRWLDGDLRRGATVEVDEDGGVRVVVAPALRRRDHAELSAAELQDHQTALRMWRPGDGLRLARSPFGPIAVGAGLPFHRATLSEVPVPDPHHPPTRTTGRSNALELRRTVERMLAAPIVQVDGRPHRVVERDLLVPVERFRAWMRDWLRQTVGEPRTYGLVGGRSSEGRRVRWRVASTLRWTVVEDPFSKEETRVVLKAFRAATDAWAAACNLRFELHRGAAPARMAFSVCKGQVEGPDLVFADSFFPWDRTKPRRIRLFPLFFSELWDPAAIAAHELGHVLGFRHEHLHPDAPGGAGAPEAGAVGVLSPYDPRSVMSAPMEGTPLTLPEPTALDVEGARLVYPLHPPPSPDPADDAWEELDPDTLMTEPA